MNEWMKFNITYKTSPEQIQRANSFLPSSLSLLNWFAQYGHAKYNSKWTEKATCILIVKQYNVVLSIHAVSVAVTSGDNGRFLRVVLNWGMGPSDTTAPTLYTITLELKEVPLAILSGQFTHTLGTWTKALTLYKLNKLFGLPSTNNALIRSSEKGSPSLLSRQSVRLCNGMICSNPVTDLATHSSVENLVGRPHAKNTTLLHTPLRDGLASIEVSLLAPSAWSAHPRN